MEINFTQSGDHNVQIGCLPGGILPLPVKNDGEKSVKSYSRRDWALKLQEELFEVNDALVSEIYEHEFKDLKFWNTGKEIADIITVCISWLETLGFDAADRAKLFEKVNEKNRKRGYFNEN